MCGRYAQFKRRKDYERYLKVQAAKETVEERPSWNVAPSTTSLIAHRTEEGLVLDRMTWGLFGRMGGLVSNARIETAADKPTFSSAWRDSRGVVPVDCWYEWQLAPDGKKQPFSFRLRTGDPVLLAALIEKGRYTLVTTETHGPLRAVHTRRPVAISLDQVEHWCDPRSSWSPEELEKCLVPEEAYQQTPVNRLVNSTRNDGPQLLEPGLPELSQQTLF